MQLVVARLAHVLIESDWNLKKADGNVSLRACTVLIESDWNLKYKGNTKDRIECRVLIESDWNLKQGRLIKSVELILY